MSQQFDFERLVELCRRTHEETRHSAACAIDRSLVVRNWLFGWYMVEFEGGSSTRREVDGKELIIRLLDRLGANGIKGCSPNYLQKCREFYQGFSEIRQTVSVGSGESPEIQQTVSAKSLETSLISATPNVTKLAERFPLGWSHYVTLLSLDSADARSFYEIEAAGNGWSVRELKQQIDSCLYERLALSRDNHEVHRLAREGQVVERASDPIKAPVALEFLGLEQEPAYSESDLGTAIIDRLQQFLLELGKGFLFEARQKRFSFEGSHFFVDLVFYNRLLRCYVLIDLKTGNLSHQDLGQMQMCVNYFDRYVTTDDELPTVGILLCDRKNDALVELTPPEDAHIYASKYQLYLPSKRELADQLVRVRREIEGHESGIYG